MERGAWRATVRGVSRVRHDLVRHHHHPGPLILSCRMCRTSPESPKWWPQSLELHVGPVHCQFLRWFPAAVPVRPHSRLLSWPRQLAHLPWLLHEAFPFQVQPLERFLGTCAVLGQMTVLRTYALDYRADALTIPALFLLFNILLGTEHLYAHLICWRRNASVAICGDGLYEEVRKVKWGFKSETLIPQVLVPFKKWHHSFLRVRTRRGW